MFVLFPAKLTNVSADQTVLEGSNSKLFCGASGSPTPNITWTKVLGDGSKSEVLYQGTVLNFPKISRTDSGVYYCEAHNGFKSSVGHKISLNVICKFVTMSFLVYLMERGSLKGLGQAI